MKLRWIVLLILARLALAQTPVSQGPQATNAAPWSVSLNGATPAGTNTIGKVDVLGNAGAVMDAAGQNVAAPANWLQIGCQFNTSPSTISSGNGSPGQCDNAGNWLVNCKSGCSSAANTTASGTVGSANAYVSIAMVGVNSVSFTLPSGNNLQATLTPEYSSDGSTTWQTTYLRAPNAQWAATVAVSSTQSTYDILVPGGSDHIRIRASAYTSGSATVSMTAVQQPEYIPADVGVAGAAVPNWMAFVAGTDGTNLRGFSTDTNGRMQINVINSLPAGANTIGAVTQASGPWTSNVTQFGGNAIATGTGAGGNGIPRVTVSNDSNVLVTQSTNPWIVAGALSNNGAAATSNFVAAAPGVVQTDPANGSAFTQGRNAAPNVGTDGTLWTSTLPGLRPASYHAAKNFAASSTTDNACIYGNATDTVLLYEVRVSGTQTTAGIINVELVRHSAAETGGTAANFTSVRDDVTNYAAASTTPVSYTGTGPTPGASVGDIDDAYTGFLAPGSVSPADIYIWNGKLKGQLLIGTGQGICVNLGGALTGGNMSVSFGWMEIKNISE